MIIILVSRYFFRRAALRDIPKKRMPVRKSVMPEV